MFALVFFLAISGLAQAKTIKLQPVNGRGLVSVPFKKGLATKPGSVKVEITEVIAFDCPPCKALDLNIISYLKDYYAAEDQVSFNIKVGYVGQRGRSGPIKTYCMGQASVNQRTMTRTLFDNPLISWEQISKVTMVPLSDYLACIDSPVSPVHARMEAADIVNLGIRSFPTLFIGTSQTRVRDKASLIRMINQELGK